MRDDKRAPALKIHQAIVSLYILEDKKKKILISEKRLFSIQYTKQPSRRSQKIPFSISI